MKTLPPTTNQDRKERETAQLEDALARARLRERRGKKLRPPPPNVGLAARKAVREVLKTQSGSPLSVLKETWPSIVGDKLAPLCQPEKLSGKPGKRTLTLKVIPAAALLVQHQSVTLRQRISAAAGGDIVKIKLVQGALSGPKRSARPASRPLNAAAARELDASLEPIEHPDLRTALRDLGSAILSQKP